MGSPGRYVITGPARRDLAELWAWIAMRSGAARAQDVVDRLREVCATLAVNPLMGRERPEVRAGVRSFAQASHVPFYEPTRDGIRILRVVHGARHLPGALRERQPEKKS